MSEVNGNGHIEAEKTPEQIASERFERYQKNPGNFIEVSEVIACCIRNNVSGIGISVFVGNCKRSELGIATTELNHIIQKRLISMDIESEMKHSAGKQLIQPAGGGIMNFVRGKR